MYPTDKVGKKMRNLRGFVGMVKKVVRLVTPCLGFSSPSKILPLAPDGVCDSSIISTECSVNHFPGSLCLLTLKLKSDAVTHALQQGTREPEVTIRLSSNSARLHNQVRYDLTCGAYRRVLASEDDLTFDLLTLPSRVIHRDLHNQMQQQQQQEQQQIKQSSKGGDEARRLMEEVYRDMVSPDDLAKLDTQPNPFNFSERVSQTNRFSRRNLAVQTEAPPSTTFALTVSPAEIHDAYLANYENELEEEMEREMEEREQERERERDRDRGNKGRGTPPPGALDPLEVASGTGLRHGNGAMGLADLSQAAKVLERMVNQNTYDDITQDFRYWEDGSDEFRPLEGSLLPLWKFHHDGSRHLVVTDICWSPIYPDLFAAAYAPSSDEGGGGPGSGGMLCLYTLKNPSTPERVFRAPCGVTCVAFHPKHGSVLAAGWADGTVVVYEAKPPAQPGVLASCTGGGKHLLPVTQVRWVLTEPGEDLCLFSVAQDGRLTQWQVHSSVLVHTDLLQFKPEQPHTISSQDRVMLEGIGTCVAFRPDNEKVILVGVDSGAVFQCTTVDTIHALTRYPAHTAPVRQVLWNTYHNHVFVSCSVDWTVKVWIQYTLSPLIVLDLGGAVSGVAWSPFNSSVVVALSDEGRVHVYDLFLRRARPLCVQSLVQRRRASATCVCPSPSHPVLLVGGERGNLICFKLSPNLRRIHKDNKTTDERTTREIELCKMERLIATNKG